MKTESIKQQIDTILERTRVELKAATGIPWKVEAEIMDPERTPSMGEIMDTVCQHYEINHNRLLTRTRKTAYVSARVVIAGMAREYGYSRKAIAAILNRKITTILSTWKNYDNWQEFDKGFRQDVIKIKQKL